MKHHEALISLSLETCSGSDCVNTLEKSIKGLPTVLPAHLSARSCSVQIKNLIHFRYL